MVSGTRLVAIIIGRNMIVENSEGTKDFDIELTVNCITRQLRLSPWPVATAPGSDELSGWL